MRGGDIFVVGFVEVCNAAHRLPCGDDSISCLNAVCKMLINEVGDKVFYANPVSFANVSSQHTPLPEPFFFGQAEQHCTLFTWSAV